MTALLAPLVAAVLAGAGSPPSPAPPPVATTSVTVTDSFVPETDDEAASEMLVKAAYAKASFEVTVSPPAGAADAMVRFPSPKPRGEPRNDTVVLEWYRAARELDGGEAPAMLVLHILGGRMKIARSVAQAFRLHGIHAFVMHLPDYGERGDAALRLRVDRFEERTWQAIADARRARDVIAALEGVDGARVGLQGTSLGAFTGSLAASIDRGAFDPVFLVLGGGDLPSMLEVGERDAARIRAQFLRAGFDLDQLKEVVRAVDPARLAHRLDPARTWLWSAVSDQVVPKENARALAEAAGLDEEHHRWMLGDHYTCAPYFPVILKQMTAIVKGTDAPPRTVEPVEPDEPEDAGSRGW